ncbi:MarR family winged helix-turn-helix transcriptional regulator [Metabacillus fastidiosus]|uniref:MarR family transcriptional regulator n=1 Tax=Metabacillus fastidiosus TaxID=1458 RepID=A0ABU6P674_9BACI|nr:MarR family transcriptional regulator [Metabacillus fastidiosus]MEC2075344.1 MarR family transcriptional regulator [Metabacillus fastidiosus]MED4403676.1 MarR family transcriptional regulator [Metabacillus fastidiosus]MED4452467.1 MarR family transcriptional regulator [Metabacillus fastidiosus]MED4463598.1 MarR family transcriptional regulator [Metabacillus fastidiosus]MED4532972.1 MarR family transcriptional regulator [Metabacillus fastidiosus]
MRSYTEEELQNALNLFKTFARAFKSISEHSIRDSKEHGFNPTEFAVLELLFTKGPQKLQQIGSRLLLVSGNVTYVIDKLEKNEFIYREQDPKDKRSVYAKLTEKGQQYLSEIYPIHAVRIARAFSGLTAEEQEELMKLLKKAGVHSQHLLFR